MEVAIAILAIFIGLIIGVAHCSEERKRLERGCASLQQSLDSSPVVIECKLGQPLTVDQMSMDVVGPNLIKIWRHFRNGLYTIPSTDQIAKAMLQWYNPDSLYTKLVIVGWLRGGEIKIAWTWQEQDSEGLEKYYKVLETRN